MHEGMIEALGPVLSGSGRTLIIQILLVTGIAAIIAWMTITRGAKQLAVRRLIIIGFAIFAVLTVIFPGVLTQFAHLVGVGRGADLLLYMTVLVLLGFLALQEVRTKNAEKRTTYLARQIAIDKAESPDSYRERSLPTP